MLYDLRKPLDAQQARTRLEQLIGQGRIVELTEKKKRSLPQNAYLHLLLGYFACQTGNTLEWVKRAYYKLLCNRELFVVQRDDPYMGRVEYVRSSSSLTTAEMTLSIERFRNWSASAAGIYLPEPEDREMLQELEIEVGRYKYYL